MTRKDYILLAGALRSGLPWLCKHCDNSPDHTFHQSVESCNGCVAPQDHHKFEAGDNPASVLIANALVTDNPRFDRGHFLAVVRGERALQSRPARKAS